MYESRDGGRTAHAMSVPSGDNHQMWIDPQNGARMMVGSDAGITLSVTDAKTWIAPNVLLAQPYHLAVDDRVPYTVCSEDQDAGSACSTSNDLVNGDIEPSDWYSSQGGESGWTVFDRTDDNIIYGSGYEGILTRFDRSTMQGATISPWPEDTSGWGAGALKYRFQWTAPVATDPWNPRALYFGANRLLVSFDRGVTWRTMSPDLTRDVKAWQTHSGGPITGDNTGPEYYDTIFTIEVSPLRAGEMWVGTDYGLAWLTLDDGAHWRDVTPRRVGMPQYGRIDYIDPSPHDAAAAYMAVEDHEHGDRTPYVYATSDFGRRWRTIASDLPRDSYVRMVKEDPVRRGLLYAGTETGLWISFDDGGSWQQLHDNFPTAPVYDFTVQRRFDDLVVSAHGRANLILDDIGPIQDFTTAVAAEPVHLFPMRDAYRFNSGGAGGQTPGAGENPQFGADVNFYLRTDPKPKQKLLIEILAGKRTIRTIGVSDAHAGINREWWDLRWDSVPKVKNAAAEGFGGFTGPEAVPGTYTVRLVDGRIAQQTTVVVLADPRESVSAADFQAQLTFMLRLQVDLRHIGDRITSLRAARDAADKAKSGPHANAAVIAAVDDFDGHVDDALNALYQPKDLGGEDDIRDPIHAYEQLNSLGGFVGSADVPPRPADYQELRVLEGRAAAGIAKADDVLSSGVAALDAVLARNGVSALPK